MSKPSLDERIAEHYEETSPPQRTMSGHKVLNQWRHGLDDLSGEGHQFIDDLIADRARLNKEIEELVKDFAACVNERAKAWEQASMLATLYAGCTKNCASLKAALDAAFVSFESILRYAHSDPEEVHKEAFYAPISIKQIMEGK